MTKHRKRQIVAVRKNEDGDISSFKLEDGSVLQYDEAVRLAKNGELAHVDVFHRFGRDIIRSEPDDSKENNLDNLPRF